MSPKTNARAAALAATPSVETETQQVLDELWNEALLPFLLNVGKITNEPGAYTIHFYDSRLRTARVPLTKGTLLRESVRSAVLDRVTKLSGPLKDWPRKV
jgi:hypothetical protein